MTAAASTVATTDRLLELIDGMAGRRVAMFVDLVADRFIHGVAKRISREAPVLILSYEGESLRPGGGANAVANVAALEGCPLPFGFVGDDGSGRELRRQLESRGIMTTGIEIRPGYRTPTKTRILGGAPHGARQQIVRYDVEDVLELSDADLERQAATLARINAEGDGVGAVVLSDYGYGAVDPRLVPRIRETLDRTVPILGDSRYRLQDFAGLDGLTPNSEEAAALLDPAKVRRAGPEPVSGDPETLQTLERAGRVLARRLATRFLLITRGRAGMSLFTSGEDAGVAHLPAHGHSQVADVTGAGDTVIGTFALALAAGASPLEAACLANYAGGVVVMKMGTATLTRDELRAAVAEDPGMVGGIRWERSAS